MILNTRMNSRFDEAVEQILNKHVVEEAAPGMASVPGAQPEPEKRGFFGGLARKAASAIGSGIKKTADWTANKAAQGAAIATGFTPGVGSSVYSGTKAAVKAPIGGVVDAWRERNLPAGSSTTTQPGQTSQPSPHNTTSNTSPTKTVANIIPTIQPQKINSTISNFPKLNADKTHLQSAIPNMLRGLRGNYSAQDLVQMVTGSIPPGSQVRQVASNTATMNKIGTDLQNYLALSDKDRAQLKAQIPALLRGIKSNATIEDVGQLLTNVLT
jgi:hypothetical protein